jgi:hypothetical protein
MTKRRRFLLQSLTVVAVGAIALVRVPVVSAAALGCMSPTCSTDCSDLDDSVCFDCPDGNNMVQCDVSWDCFNEFGMPYVRYCSLPT